MWGLIKLGLCIGKRAEKIGEQNRIRRIQIAAEETPGLRIELQGVESAVRIAREKLDKAMSDLKEVVAFSEMFKTAGATSADKLIAAEQAKVSLAQAEYERAVSERNRIANRIAENERILQSR